MCSKRVLVQTKTPCDDVIADIPRRSYRTADKGVDDGRTITHLLDQNHVETRGLLIIRSSVVLAMLGPKPMPVHQSPGMKFEKVMLKMTLSS